MTEEWKTLKQLWDENGQKPFDAVQKDGDIMHVIGVTPSGSAVGWGNNGFAASWSFDIPAWKLHKLKKKSTLYPALYMHGYRYFVTNEFYISEKQAKALAQPTYHPDCFVRLLEDRGVEVEVEE